MQAYSPSWAEMVEDLHAHCGGRRSHNLSNSTAIIHTNLDTRIALAIPFTLKTKQMFSYFYN
jgi:hypothetical protein